MVPNHGYSYTQAHIVANDISNTANAFDRENGDLNSGDAGFEPLYIRQEFHGDEMELTIEIETVADRMVVDRKTSYDLTPRVYAFSAKHYDRDRFTGFEYNASASAGVGLHLLNDGSNRLDVDIGAGSSAYRLPANADIERETIDRLGLQFTSQLSASSQVRQDLVIESSRTNTSLESRTTWSFAMNSKLALEMLFAVRKNSSPPSNILPMDQHTALHLSYVF